MMQCHSLKRARAQATVLFALPAFVPDSFGGELQAIALTNT
jgi:hypothetical protein